MKDLGTKTLITDRLILRKFTSYDVDGMYNNWGADYNTSGMLSWDVHESKDYTLGIIANWIKEYSEPYNFNWIVELKETKEVIGNISCIKCRVSDEICEIGYSYGSKFWGNGYASEALKAVIHFLINEVGMRLVEAAHISENMASGRVMEKAGMKKDTVLRSRRINKLTKNVNDLFVYSITKNELV